MGHCSSAEPSSAYSSHPEQRYSQQTEQRGQIPGGKGNQQSQHRRAAPLVWGPPQWGQGRSAVIYGEAKQVDSKCYGSGY